MHPDASPRDSDNMPPRLAQRFLRWFLRDDLLEEVQGDLEEKFYATVKDRSLRQAKLNYWYQVLHYLRPFAIRNLESLYSHSNHYAMYKSYFKIGWRNLFKHKGYSFINVSGLAVGMAVAILIGLWVYDELSFNKYHKNYDRLAWVMQNITFSEGIQTEDSQPMQLAPELRSNYGAHFNCVITTSFPQRRTLRQGDKALARRGLFMEPAAPEMLSLRMIAGTREGLTEPNSVLLPKATARAFFSDEDPMGQMLLLGKQEVKVTGVYEDLPHNSSFTDVAFIAPWELYAQELSGELGWGHIWFQTIVQLTDHAKMDQVSATVKDAVMKRVLEEDNDAPVRTELFLQPMVKAHLYSDFEQGVNVGGRIQYVWLFGTIGVFVLLLACINFMNLSTARSEKRAKEIGVRKAIGSLRSQLVRQFFTESLLVASLAFVVALALVPLMLPAFNEVAGKEISLPWLNLEFWLAGLGFVLLTGTLAGSYPALYLSSLRPVRVLKGTFRAGRTATLPRKALVVTQFAVSVSLIIGTLVVFQQIQFVKNRPIGYDIDRLIGVPIRSDEVNAHFMAFRNDLLQTGVVEEVAKADSPVTGASALRNDFVWKGKDPNLRDQFVTMRVSHEFGQTVDWKIVEGRDFSRDFTTDTAGVVINEAAVKYMGLKNPIGEQVKRGDNSTYTIIGVVEDMITQSPYAPVRPTAVFIDEVNSRGVHIKLASDVNTQTALAAIEAVFKKHNPANLFEYEFADEEYAQKFATEVRVGKLSSFFALLAILISCLGLFGLALFVAEQRTKEIGIRKVLGASAAQLWQLLSRDFVVLVAISCLMAIPVAYYFARDWLQHYEYRTELHWWVFAGAGLGAMFITLLTVSYQTVRAALANPVKSLRSE
ncbi:MAG: ABC transporter permease [Tunicatimonas sp.]